MADPEKTVLVPLLPGFEELEAVTLIDLLRRAHLRVVVASDAPGPVVGAHGVAVVADASLDRVVATELDMIALPGGMPGARNLAEHRQVQALITALAETGRFTAAICAAPMALARAGVLRGKRATCYPGFEAHLEGAELVAGAVVVDGKVLTSRGPGTAIPFALALIEALLGAPAAAEVRGQLQLV